MKTIKVDRRIRKTRDLLKRTLSELVRDFDLKDITVKDITDKADLNRGTFYLHYKDTYDLMEKMEDDIITEFQDMIDKYKPQASLGTLLPMLDPIADYMLENKDICSSMFQANSNISFMPKFRQLISDNGAEFIKAKFPNYNKEIYEYYITFISFGILGQLQHWFDTDLHFPKNDLIKIIDKIITGAATSVLA